MRRFSNVIAFDDEPFSPAHRGDVRIVGTVFAACRLDGVLIGKVRRDGANAARNMVSLISESRFTEHVRLVMLQGVTLGGFNVVDVGYLHRHLGLPVLVVARSEPDLDAIRTALLDHVPGGMRKWKLIEGLGRMEPVGSVFVQRVGLSLEEASTTLELLTRHGNIPEPLRVAHLMAGALGSGQSRGRA